MKRSADSVYRRVGQAEKRRYACHASAAAAATTSRTAHQGSGFAKDIVPYFFTLASDS